jgi:hypothetical protein
VFLPPQVLTGLALAAHRGVTLRSLAEPGYGIATLLGSVGIVLLATALVP